MYKTQNFALVVLVLRLTDHEQIVRYIIVRAVIEVYTVWGL